MKTAITALAHVAGVTIQDSAKVIRRNPVLGDEIHIDEELIHLKDTLNHYRTTRGSLKDYPKLEKHMKQELRLVVMHAIGLIWRMSSRQPLPQSYTEQDTKEAIRRLCRILVDYVHQTNQSKRVTKRTYRLLEPYMTISQRRRFDDGFMLAAYARVITRRPMIMR